MISEHLNKDSLHHAYLIEGEKEEILPELFAFLNKNEIKVLSNPNVVQINLDSFKMENATYFKSLSFEKGYEDEKKIFIISANNFLLEAQNALLKIFEEPSENMHIFLIVPNINILLPTLRSRAYFIKVKKDIEIEYEEAEKFISMSLDKRIDYLKKILGTKDEEEEEDLSKDSIRSRMIKFLDALEYVLHRKLLSEGFPKSEKIIFFEQIFKARQYLYQPGSSAKSLMESVALSIPNF